MYVLMHVHPSKKVKKMFSNHNRNRNRKPFHLFPLEMFYFDERFLKDKAVIGTHGHIPFGTDVCTILSRFLCIQKTFFCIAFNANSISESFA